MSFWDSADAYARTGESQCVAERAFSSYERGELTWFVAGENIVHRDLAARNFLMQTDFGVYESAAGEAFVFGVNAPFDYVSGGPVTWTRQFSIRLYLNGDETSEDSFVFNGTWFTDTVIPAPGGAGILALGGLAAARRRR
jgi:hypothetical protein